MNNLVETDFPGEYFLCDIPKNNLMLEELVPLNENSLVVDIGCYDGTWLDRMHRRYSCYCIGVEPLVSKYTIAKERDAFKNNEKVKLFNYGLTTNPLHTKGITIKGKADGSKIYPVEEVNLEASVMSLSQLNSCSLDSVETVDMRCAENFFADIDSPIDVLTINIEGAEYGLIAFMLSKQLFTNIKGIQIQFHEINERSRSEMRSIISELKSIGYSQRFNYEFVWFGAVK